MRRADSAAEQQVATLLRDVPVDPGQVAELVRQRGVLVLSDVTLPDQVSHPRRVHRDIAQQGGYVLLGCRVSAPHQQWRPRLVVSFGFHLVSLARAACPPPGPAWPHLARSPAARPSHRTSPRQAGRGDLETYRDPGYGTKPSPSR